jgi:4-carboxymuconolactone decarboxylase
LHETDLPHVTDRIAAFDTCISPDAAIVQLVDHLYADDCVTDTTWDEATRHFSAADMVHLRAVAGCHRLVGGFLNSAGVQLDGGVPGWPTAPPG